jgi:opacity protein-like surface antigen
MKRVLILLAGALLPLLANAQYWEIGGMLGASNYSGDLSPSLVVIGETHPAVGGIVRYNLTPNWTLKGNAYYGRISGSDANATNEVSKARNLNFRSDVLEIGGNLEWNLKGYKVGSRNNRFSPYLFAGLSIFKFDPEGLDNTGDSATMEWVRLQPLGTEGQGTTKYNDRKKYSLTQVSIPLGAGIKYNFSGNWTFGVEAGMRKTFTDYLDDVSTTYVEPNILAEAYGDLSVRMSNKTDIAYGPNKERGNATNKDWYMFAGLTLTYTIMPRKCYEF